MSSALRPCLLQAPAQNLFLATHAFSSIDTADAAGRAYRHRGGAGTGPEFAVHGGASTTHRDMSRSMGGARAPLYAAWCPGPDLSGSSVRCLLGVEIMWRSRRDDACTTPSCEVTDAIAFADFGAPGAGPRLGIPRVSGSRGRVSYLDETIVPRRYRPRTTYMRSVMTDLSPGRLPGSGSRLLDWRTVKTGQRNCGRVQLRVRWIPAVSWALWCRPSS